MESRSPKAGAERLPILPLRNSVLFPMSVAPINVGRPRSVRLVEDIHDQERALVGVIAQRSAGTVEPTFDDLYSVGTVARVVKVIRLGDENYSVVLTGIARFRIAAPGRLEPYMTAAIERLGEASDGDGTLPDLARRLRERTRKVMDFLPELPRETSGILDNVREPGALADLIASNFPEDHVSIEQRQRILEAKTLEERVRLVLEMVERRLQVLEAKGRITSQIREEMSRSQREYVLRQQMRGILEELGESAEQDEIDELRERIARAELPADAETVARKQLSRLRSMSPQSAEFNVARTYVEWLADIPWRRSSPDRVDVKEVRRCLDEDHHGLEQVKRRIVEFCAIRQLRTDKKGPILLFIGPPGVGKTSLGRSIARATGRRYGRISLGGVRDEAEIRGHRRTYVGALPGRIIQALKKVGTKNPVLVLDEVDKMGVDLRGDPAAALLEVLDPAQNTAFVDHYIDVPVDLSQVLFLATANSYSGIPDALADRMEIIDVPGYTRTDKIHISRDFLIPKQLREHGLTEEHIEFPQDGVEVIIDSYTREAGVRNLEREIAALCRDVAVKLAEGKPARGIQADPAHVESVLGTRRHRPEVAERKLTPGVATGLALNSAGGDLLFIEATRMPGKGEIQVTGNLPAVMRESAATALSYVRSRAERLWLDPEWIKGVDIHLHVPRGGYTRDAASSGAAMVAAVASLMLQVPTRPEVALTGEVTLRGNLLPVSGVKEKILAAHRAGIKELLLPIRNQPDVEDIPKEILAELQVRFVSRMDEALEIVLDPEALAGARTRASGPPSSDQARP